jgi:arylsulfatase A-like enzyme
LAVASVLIIESTLRWSVFSCDQTIFVNKRIALNASDFPESKFTMITFCFKRLLAVLTATLLALAFGAQADDVKLAPIFTNTHARALIPRRASIIFIQCHGLGYGDLSCYGQTNFQTPNLDKLAAGGMRFNNYSPGDTNMALALAALMAGKSPATDGIAVAQVLKNVGYKTGLIGEWPLAGEPQKQGFDEFAGFLNPDEATNYYADYLWRCPYIFSNTIGGQWTELKSEDGMKISGKEMIYDNTGGKKGKYMPDLILDTMLQNFIRSNQPDRFNRFCPFFLLVNLPAPRTATPGADDFPVPSDAPFSDEPWPQAAKNRAALITRLDGDIGRLFEQLNKLGMTNNVAIFFSSSSAPEKFADPKLNFFRTAADLQSRSDGNWNAPMIVYWPGKILAGQASDFNWSAQDFLPTAAQIGYARVPEAIDGHSILPVLLGKRPESQP